MLTALKLLVQSSQSRPIPLALNPPEVAGPPTLGVAIRGVIAEEGGEAARRSLFDYPLRVAHPPLAVTVRRVHQLSTVRTMVPSPPPIGGRLSGYWEGWVHIGAEPWVLSTIRYGYKIPFLNPPPLTMVPIHRGPIFVKSREVLGFSQGHRCIRKGL